ncbi:MAG: hypothetical protein E6G83_21060, partial [Alphaproteobacteria bacterium]
MPPAVRGHRRASRGARCRDRPRTGLFRRPRPLRNGRRPSADRGALGIGTGISGHLPAPAVCRRGLARPRPCDPRAARSRISRRDAVDVLYNSVYGVSSTFGVEPWPYYLLGELGVWGGAGATMLLLTAIGAWRLPLLLVVAIVILAVHSGIAHKEYRFIYPAVVPLTVLAGVGLAQMASWGREWLTGRSMPLTAAAATSAAFAVAWWGLASSQVWNGTTLTAYRRWMHDSL